MQVYPGRHPDCPRPGRWKWAPQPLSLDFYAAVLAVSAGCRLRSLENLLTECQRQLCRVDARTTGCGPRLAPVHQPPVRPCDGKRDAPARILQRLPHPGLPLPSEGSSQCYPHALEADSVNPDTVCSRERSCRLQGQEHAGHCCRAFILAPSTVAALTRGTRKQAASIVGHIDRETALHLTYCEGFGVSRDEMEATEEKQACTAYTRYAAPGSPRPLPRSEIDLADRCPCLAKDTCWTSASPRTGSACKSPSPRASWATAPWRRCCTGTPGLSGKATTTGTGSRTTSPMTTCKP